MDLEKLAYAVRVAETSNCTTGTALTYNNCYGIKDGSIAPCTHKSPGGFCIYLTHEESTEAFKKIWVQGYGGNFPNDYAASVWTGNDNPTAWLKNVQQSYYD